LALQQR
jgi:predicted  nucleic acid-binding Zn-ribbon protein